MTELEAREKWCPMVRFGDESSNRGAADMQTPNPNCKSLWNNCIASDCMMWVQTDNECIPRAQSPTDISEPECYPAGHCGLTK